MLKVTVLCATLIACGSESPDEEKTCGPSSVTCADLEQQEADVLEAYETFQIQATARNELIAEIQKEMVRKGCTRSD
jgi:hypothetical protein